MLQSTRRAGREASACPVGPGRHATSLREFVRLPAAVQRRAWRELAHAIDREREGA